MLIALRGVSECVCAREREFLFVSMCHRESFHLCFLCLRERDGGAVKISCGRTPASHETLMQLITFYKSCILLLRPNINVNWKFPLHSSLFPLNFYSRRQRTYVAFTHFTFLNNRFAQASVRALTFFPVKVAPH